MSNRLKLIKNRPRGQDSSGPSCDRSTAAQIRANAAQGIAARIRCAEVAGPGRRAIRFAVRGRASPSAYNAGPSQQAAISAFHARGVAVPCSNSLPPMNTERPAGCYRDTLARPVEGGQMSMALVNDGAPARPCLQCGEAMQHLADMNPTTTLPAVRMYLCLYCNTVVEEKR